MKISTIELEGGIKLLPVGSSNGACEGCYFQYTKEMCNPLCEPGWHDNHPVILVEARRAQHGT